MDEYHYERECENCGKTFTEYGECDPPGWYDGRSYFHGYFGGNLVWWDTGDIYTHQYLLCNKCMSKKSVMEKFKKAAFDEAVKTAEKRLVKSEKDYRKAVAEHTRWIEEERKELRRLKRGEGEIKYRCHNGCMY